MRSIPPVKPTLLRHGSKTKGPYSPFLALQDPVLPTLPQGFKKHLSSPPGYIALHKAAAAHVCNFNVSQFSHSLFPAVSFPCCPCNIKFHKKVLFCHFSAASAIPALVIPQPPSQAASAHSYPRMLQESKLTGSQKGHLPSAIHGNECPLWREQGEARGLAQSQPL